MLIIEISTNKTKTVDCNEGALQLATQTLNILCHSPLSNVHQILACKNVNVAGINELKTHCAL